MDYYKFYNNLFFTLSNINKLMNNFIIQQLIFYLNYCHLKSIDFVNFHQNFKAK